MLNKHLRTTYKNKSNNLLIFSTDKKGNAFFLILWNKIDEKDLSILVVRSLLCKKKLSEALSLSSQQLLRHSSQILYNSLPHNLRIDLGGRDIAVSQEFLYDRYTHSLVYQ